MWNRIASSNRQRRVSDTPPSLIPSRAEDPELEAALAERGFETAFQPIFELANGQLAGAEALTRMPGCDDGEALFRRASSAGLAERLSREMQRDALRSAAAWGPKLDRIGISINVLPQDLARTDYANWLVAEIVLAGIDCGRVTVEITEQAAIDDFAGVSARLERLRALGVKVALDDFGSGFASLAHLARLPLDSLKIDRALIAGIEQDHRQRLVVRAILALARDLGLKVVVEGVETAPQLELLREWGCDHYQGFVRGRAMPPTQFEQFAAFHS